MSTVIKINKNMEIKGCNSCPFLVYQEDDYGHESYYCNFDPFNKSEITVKIGEFEIEAREDKPEDCPIIETNSKVDVPSYIKGQKWGPIAYATNEDISKSASIIRRQLATRGASEEEIELYSNLLEKYKINRIK